VSGFLPVPGSPIYKDYKKYGIKYIDKDWDKYSHLLFRFSDEEEVGLPFEYEQDTTWGKSFTRDEIKHNIIETQRWLDARGMIY
jgi:UDP-galactopyranose mutase